MARVLRAFTRDEVERRVENALKDLREKHGDLFDVGERAITAQLKECLVTQFPDWDVDAEYDQNGGARKTLGTILVIPDVIVHHRRTGVNLLVVEVKKSRGRGSAHDRDKLVGFTKVAPAGLGYRWGVHVVLGSTAADGPSLTWFEAGAAIA